jgi:hypothetical protein
VGGKLQRCMKRGIGARASAALAGCARTHSAPSFTRSRRRARWLTASPAPAAACVSLGTPHSTRRLRNRSDVRVSLTSRTAIGTSDVASFESSPFDLSDSSTPRASR